MKYLDAFERCQRVWWRGLATGLPLVSLVTLVEAYLRLKREGISSWDRDGGFVVSHGPIRAYRVLLFFGLLILFLGLTKRMR